MSAPLPHWPARRAPGAFELRNDTVLHVTPTDIVIGRSYVPPPAPLGSEAERIQVALLRPVPRNVDGKIALLAAWIGAFVLLAISKGWL